MSEGRNKNKFNTILDRATTITMPCIAIVRLLWQAGRSCVCVCGCVKIKGQRGMDQQTVFWSLILCDLLL